jgi:integrase
MIKAATTMGRHGVRDATLILIAYRHGLRVSELVALRWDQVDLAQGLVHIARRKNGVPPCIHFEAQNCVRYVGCNEIIRRHPMCFSVSASHH